MNIIQIYAAIALWCGSSFGHSTNGVRSVMIVQKCREDLIACLEKDKYSEKCFKDIKYKGDYSK